MKIHQHRLVAITVGCAVRQRTQEDSYVEDTIEVCIDEYLLVGTIKFRNRGVAKTFKAKCEDPVARRIVDRKIAGYANVSEDVWICGRSSAPILQLQGLHQA